jgi:hypothetical protein
LTNNEVHEQLIEWLGGLLSIVVIKDRQQADRPTLPYGMVDLSNWRDLSQNVDKFVYVDSGDDVIATPDIEIEWVFIFFIYGPSGENLMRRLQSAVHLSQLQEPLRPNLTIHEVSAANSIPELMGEKWEPRTQVNITVRGKSSNGFVVDVIEEHSFNFTGERA